MENTSELRARSTSRSRATLTHARSLNTTESLDFKVKGDSSISVRDASTPLYDGEDGRERTHLRQNFSLLALAAFGLEVTNGW